jgi:hypothetical protein
MKGKTSGVCPMCGSNVEVDIDKIHSGEEERILFRALGAEYENDILQEIHENTIHPNVAEKLKVAVWENTFMVDADTLVYDSVIDGEDVASIIDDMTEKENING